MQHDLNPHLHTIFYKSGKEKSLDSYFPYYKKFDGKVLNILKKLHSSLVLQGFLYI